MAEPIIAARSPITPSPPVAVEAGWEVSGRRSRAALTIVDVSPLAKVLVKGGAAAEHALGVPFGRAGRDELGALVTGSGPGEWLILAPPGTQAQLTERIRYAIPGAGELVTVIDLTHGRALMRVTGPRVPDMLAKVCAIDFAEQVTPNGAAFRSSVARLVTDVVRDDRGGAGHSYPSYLLHCERSSGQYLFDVLLDAGAEFGIEVDGFLPGREAPGAPGEAGAGAEPANQRETAGQQPP